MPIDWTNPTVQGAVLAATITVVGVTLAALAGLAGSLVGARIARRATQEADERRHAWDVEQRRQAKGEAAAEAVLDTLNELDLGLFSVWKTGAPLRAGALNPRPEMAELEPYYSRIQRLALAIPNEAVRGVLDDVASALYQYRDVVDLSGRSAGRVWWQVHDEAKRVLGAYLRGEPLPEAPETHRMALAIEEEIERLRADYEADVGTEAQAD